eukprot:scaffold1019_cov255-Pinguiococcus_pyrenoidosus.AAC.10
MEGQSARSVKRLLPIIASRSDLARTARIILLNRQKISKFNSLWRESSRASGAVRVSSALAPCRKAGYAPLRRGHLQLVPSIVYSGGGAGLRRGRARSNQSARAGAELLPAEPSIVASASGKKQAIQWIPGMHLEG